MKVSNMTVDKMRANKYGYLVMLVACTAVVIIFFTKSIKDIFHSHTEVVSSSQQGAFKVITSGCDLLLENNFCILLKTKSKLAKVSVWISSKSPENFKLHFNTKEISISKLVETGNNTQRNFHVSAKTKSEGTLIEIFPSLEKNTLALIDSRANKSWSMSVNLRAAPAWLEDVYRLREKKKVNLLLTRLNALDDSISDIEQALKQYYLGRVYIALGQIDNALKSTKKSQLLFSGIGAKNKVLDNKTLLSYIYLQMTDDLVLAKQTIDALEPVNNDAHSLFYQNYYQGSLYAYLGDLRKAESHINDSKKIAREFELSKEALDAQFVYSNILIESGRINEAIKIRRSLLDETETPLEDCKKAVYLDGLAWAQLQQIGGLYDVENSSKLNPMKILKEALLLSKKSCPNRLSMKINLLLNMATAYLLNSDYEAARKVVEEIKKSSSSLSYRQKLDFLELQGKLSIQSSDTATALNSFNRLFKLSESVRYSSFMIKALVGLAETYQFLGENNAAIEHYAKATELVFDHSLRIPITSSQPNFISKVSSFSKRYIEYLYQSGRIDEALSVARKFRANWMQDLFQLSQLDSQKLSKNPAWISTLSKIRKVRNSIVSQQSTIWTLPESQLLQSDELLVGKKRELARLFDLAVSIVNQNTGSEYVGYAAPKTNEVFMFFYPVEHGWLGFAKNKYTIKTHLISSSQERLLSPEQMAQIWIRAFEPMIAEHDTIKFYPFGKLKNVDFQSLRYGSDILLSYKKIHYGVDLARKKQKQPISKLKRNSLVVANSLGDLKETEKEAIQVTQLTTNSKWQSHLLTTNQAKFLRIKKQLEESQHFHYAGHVFHDKYSSSQYLLPLADNAYLDSNDIIILDNAPKWVVLSACNSARNDLQVSTESVGLAQAFIMSGSEQVIASSRPVLDKHANILMTEFYKKWMASDNFLDSFRTAQLNLINSHPEADWLAFRILVL